MSSFGGKVRTGRWRGAKNLLNEVVTSGSQKLDNEKIARLVLNEVYWQIKLQEILIEAHKNLLYTIQVKYAENEKVL